MFDSRLRVLIAEDETIIRLDLRQILEENGLDVCAEARDGLEAIELARATNPDVAILDVKMPNLDGIEAARRIYAERPMPIVMLTAYSEAALVTRAVGAGVFGYLTKPFGPNDVAPAIHTAVARHDELLEARREVGRAQDPLDVDVRASDGTLVPLRFRRRPDGTLDVTLQKVK
jgi:two-component system, response regulator PdtaR